MNEKKLKARDFITIGTLPLIQKAVCGGLRWLNDFGRFRCPSLEKRT